MSAPQGAPGSVGQAPTAMQPPSATAWRRPALLFALASFVEMLGFGHLGAFTPLYLQQLGVPAEALPQWTGLLAGATFILGLALAPLWGVWADRYSRKLIIVRSTVGEGVIFLLFGIAGAPWHLLFARLLVGFILGNTGVMYAMLADIAPRHQLATAIGFITAGSTLGMSAGPLIGGWLVGRIGISQLYVLDAVAAWIVAFLLIVGLRERRSAPRSTASTAQLLRALPGNLRASPIILPLFALYFVAFLGMNMQGPFVPLLVAEVYEGADLPVAIGTVMLVTGLISAVCTPLLGRLGGRLGHRRVLALALVGAAIVAIGQAVAPDYGSLLVARGALGLVQGGTGPLIVSMIALATPEDRRASVLNITLFPGYLAHLLGAGAGSAIATLGIRAVFASGSLVLLAAAGFSALSGRQRAPAPVAPSHGDP